MIKYFVRTTGERTFDYDLNYELLIDKEKKPVESFIKQLKYISQFDSVLLEDDLILCKDFKDKIEDVIKQYPNDIINFFYNPSTYFTTHYGSAFCWNQCTYYPKGISLRVAEEMGRIQKNLPNMQYDLLENVALQNLGIRHVVYRPCLVQHIDESSLIQKNDSWFNRRTIYFEDYLNELGIKYEDAYKPENRKKLQQKTNKQFKI
jgi:hypothetical protein